MKKRNIVVVVLVIALLLMGSAYALWTDSVVVEVTAQSATMDVQIVERTESVTTTSSYGVNTVLGTPSPATIDVSEPTATVSESITNFIPGDTVTLTYKIVNTGSIDVLLTGVNIAFPGTTQSLQALTQLNWTIDEYVGATLTDSTSGSGTLSSIATSVTTTGDGVEILAGTSDYCLLTLEMYIDDVSGIPYSTEKETSFTITPVFTQN